LIKLNSSHTTKLTVSVAKYQWPVTYLQWHITAKYISENRWLFNDRALFS